MTTYNEGKTLEQALSEEIENLSDSELVEIWNEYCEQNSMFESKVHAFDVDTFNVVCSGLSPWEVAEKIDTDRFNCHDDWFRRNANDWIQSTNNPTDFVEISDLMEWLERAGNWEGCEYFCIEEDYEDEEDEE